MKKAENLTSGRNSDKAQTARKTVFSTAIVAISVAAYVAFGFFFDVFLEVIPLLAIPFITVPFSSPKRLSKTYGKNIRLTDSTSTILGRSLGDGLAAYFMTQYAPAKGEENPFTNFVIVDNGYLEYYNRHLPDFESAMNAAGGAAFSPVTVLRIWGGAVNPSGDAEQAETAKKVADYGVALPRRNENFAADGQSVGSEKTRNRNVRTSLKVTASSVRAEISTEPNL